jgi:hypothetical protein
MIQKKKVEQPTVDHLKGEILSAENSKYVYDNVEKEIAKSLNEVPEELKQKRTQQEKIQAELQNLLNFIKAGNFSKMVSAAVTDVQGRSEKVREEIQGLEFQKKGAFRTPAKEWMEHRLEKLHETLGGDIKMAALALKDLLGSIEMEPVPSECVVEGDRLIQSRAYYMAHSNIDTLALFKEGKGSNSLDWRKR